MALRYKIDVLPSLKAAGYNTTRLNREKLLSPQVVQYLREGKMISMDTLDKLCNLLSVQPGDIIEFYNSASTD